MEAPPVLRVEFFDNSAFQYDSNASEIVYDSPGGKLFLGDKFSAAFVQLQHRHCTTVVSCCMDMHGYAKEEDVTYLRIDPDYDENTHFEESCEFILQALTGDAPQNVVVFCESGNVKSAMITCYFLMVNDSISLCEAYTRIRSHRPSVKIFPRLMKVLIEAEIQLRGAASLAVDGRNICVVESVLNEVD